MVYILLGQGFEEIEAVTVLDILRRAGVEVLSVGIDSLEITGGHGIKVTADITLPQARASDADMLVLPGGMGGVNSIKVSEKAMELIKYCAEHGRLLAAICAAPMILGGLGLLDGVRATCYPGCQDSLGAAVYEPEEAAVRDGNIITGRGPGSAAAFALKLVEAISGTETAAKVKDALC